MITSAVKSKPSYVPLAADTGGRYHLLLGMGEGSACLLRVLRELQTFAPASWQRTRVLFASTRSSTAAVAINDDPFAELGFEGAVVCADGAALLERARAILEGSLMGTRVYIAGPESFIGRVLQLAAGFNLNQDEIRAEHIGTAARRVHCVHCRASMEDVRTNIVRCAGCSRWLSVRDHYSRRLAAYMGVIVDAEAPGELPPIRELYT
jgi:ferredoxin-NADP reductase